MALPTTNLSIPNNVQVQGSLTCNSFNAPSGCVNNAAVLGGANVDASKLNRRLQPVYRQPSASPAAVDQQALHIAHNPGTVVNVDVGAIVANLSPATVVFDLLKNGASILGSPITLDNTTPAYALKAGTIAAAPCNAGDVFEAKVVSATAGGGTLAKGIFLRLTIEEQGT